MRKVVILGALVVVVLVAALLATTTLAHDNSDVANGINPADGATITTSSTTLTVTFGGDGQGTGCGLGATIQPTVSSGVISDVSTSCDDGLWTWTATWSGYGSGEQSVTVEFLQTHGGEDGLKFRHDGSVTANYYVELPTEDCPAAPAVAARLLREAGMDNKDEGFKNYIAQVADHMGPQTDFDDVEKCDLEDYEAAVERFLQEIGALPVP